MTTRRVGGNYDVVIQKDIKIMQWSSAIFYTVSCNFQNLQSCVSIFCSFQEPVNPEKVQASQTIK